ncbi:hypothetical protein EPO04_00450 [Patescibacteria group bacterium]|nr:MAG: hypothetical protein EPO04_00450 [Patescibacteria group bacterium]
MSSIDLPNNIEDCEAYLKENDAGTYIDFIQDARKNKLDYAMFTFGAFAHEPELLRTAILYASLMDVTLTIPPIHTVSD